MKASRLLPVGLMAKIGERVIGPVLCSRMAGLMEASRAVEVAARMSDTFLADVSALLEPRRAQAVIAHMEDEQRRHVAVEIEALGPRVFERIIPLRHVLESAPTLALPGLAAIALHLGEGARAEVEALLRRLG